MAEWLAAVERGRQAHAQLRAAQGNCNAIVAKKDVSWSDMFRFAGSWDPESWCARVIRLCNRQAIGVDGGVDVDGCACGLHLHVRCMVTDQVGVDENTCRSADPNSKQLRAVVGGIVPMSAKPEQLRKVGIQDDSDLTSPSNGLVLLRTIKEAFDQLRVSFVPKNPMYTRSLVMKVWDPELLVEEVYPNHTFAEFDGKPLLFPSNPLLAPGDPHPSSSHHQLQPRAAADPELDREFFADGSCPFLLGLAWHALQAYINAVEQGWVVHLESKPGLIQPFFPRNPRRELLLKLLASPEAEDGKTMIENGFFPGNVNLRDIMRMRPDSLQLQQQDAMSVGAHYASNSSGSSLSSASA